MNREKPRNTEFVSKLKDIRFGCYRKEKLAKIIKKAIEKRI